MFEHSTSARRVRRSAVVALAALVALTGCGATADGGSVSADDDIAVSALGAVGSLDSSTAHTISVEFDEDDYDAMLETYTSTGGKEWIEATITIDGEMYEQVGFRLKGNSSLRAVSADDDPATIPWLIKLDKYVDDQSHDGLTDLVVRSNSTDTSINEAVALELLEAAGLASQDAIAVAFSVNGGDTTLRLVIEHPDDTWMSEEFDDDGALYKAESTGDYSYRGDDADAYDDVFDQEAGDDNADLDPLIEFLQFLNESDDETFAAELEEWLDVDAFATYLAMQDLIGNVDDIDGPGNNSYLYYDTETERFTVVAWDHNLAFGVQNVGDDGGPGQMPGADGMPDIVDMPEMGERPQRPDGASGGGFGGPMSGSNVLVERFTAVAEWSRLVDDRTVELEAALYDSGVASEIVDTWSAIVVSTGLVDQATADADAAQILAMVES
ncbi:MAG: CotH kinase family protein [Ilumatobacter sp.]|nr:CotH kinase family protein [Ilumatobacter sp.]